MSYGQALGDNKRRRDLARRLEWAVRDSNL